MYFEPLYFESQSCCHEVLTLAFHWVRTSTRQALRTVTDALKANAPVSTRIIYLSGAFSPATEGGEIGCFFSCLRCCLKPVLGNMLVDNDQCTWFLGAQTDVPFTVVRMVRAEWAL